MSGMDNLDAISREFDLMHDAFCDWLIVKGVRLTRAQLAERLGVHRNTIPSLIASGMPKPAPDGKWILGRVYRWERMRQRAAGHTSLVTPEPPDGGTHHLYRHFDASGRLLYIGISLSAIQRLAQHKERSPWYSAIARVTIEQHSTRRALLRAERIAIQTERPAFNVAHRLRGTEH